jgi:MHS family shikimate/dehydroshikimate transporter-like MFS transporter
MAERDFVAWGWRVPFLLSALVVLFGLYVRLRVRESETFRAVRESGQSHRAPLKILVRDNRREVVAGTLTKFVEAAVFPFYTVFLVSYAKAQDVDSGIVLDAVIIAIIAELVLLPVWGALTDRVGRKPVYLAATALNLVLVVPAFLAIGTGNGAVITLVLIAGLAVGHGATYAPQASWFPELFPSRARYSGVSIVWQFGSMIASGPFTVVAAALLAASGGGFGLSAVYVGVLILISLVALRWMPETAPRRRGGEYADWPTPEETRARAQA